MPSPGVCLKGMRKSYDRAAEIRTLGTSHPVVLHNKGIFYTVLNTTIYNYNSNKSPTRCNNFSVYYPDVYLQLNMFRAFSRPSSGAQ